MPSSAGSASGNREKGGRRFTPVADLPGWVDGLADGATSLGVSLPPGAAGLFLRYAELLQRWGRRVNLTSRLEPGEILSLHFLDSLSLLAVAPPSPGETVTDLGTGGGFPGIPLAIVRPDLRLTLLEPSLKRVFFLRTAVHELGLPAVEVVRGRGGEIELPPAELVVCRAVAPLEELLPLAETLLGPGGRFAAWKGPGEAADNLSPGWVLESRFSIAVPGRTSPREILLFRRA